MQTNKKTPAINILVSGILCAFLIFTVYADELPFDHFFELVGIDCEKATVQMTFGEVDAIRTCLRTQNKFIFNAWEKLEAEGKVVKSPELRTTVIKLSNDHEKKEATYIEYYNQLPNHPTNAQWSAWKHKYVEWMNAYNDYNMAIIRLMDEEIKAYTERKKYEKLNQQKEEQKAEADTDTESSDIQTETIGDEYNPKNEFQGYK